MAALPALLRQLRERAGLTQEELAEAAGVSARTISDTERGIRSRIYVDTASRLAHGLGLDGAERATFLDAARGRSMTQAVPSGALPHPLTALVDRRAELALLEAELQPAGERRLVTITGLGGAGKTRLAVAAAERLVPAYDGRVRMLTLSGNERLLDAAAAALGTVADKVAVATSGRPTLLVLDAFEHVMPAADLLADLLHEAGDLHVLVTSRIRLRIPGEREIALGPLPPAAAASLFLQRAADVAPHDLIDDPPLVADICELVSGLPLPLELAAAHARYLPLGLLRDRLHAGLTDASRVVQDAVTWSMSSLSAAERKVLANASTFAAGWRLDALHALCPAADVAQTLGLLADRGLIVLDAAQPVPRWRMLDAVREAAARLGPPDPSRRSAYTRFYLDLLDDAGRQVGHEDAWFRTLAVEEPNIRTALEWAAERNDAQTLLALATGMWLFWQSRGGLAEGRGWLARGLAMQPAAGPALRRTALWGIGWLAYHQGDDDAAAAAADELAGLAADSSDELARRNALTITGMVAIARDRPRDAVSLLTEALHIARALDQPWIRATSSLNLALAQLAGGSIAPARSLLGEALERYEAIGDRRFHSRCIGYLGLAALLDDDPPRARALFRQSLAAFRDLGEPAGIAEALAGLAAVAAAAGDPTAAATLGGAADRLRWTVAARELPLERRVAARYLDAAAEQLGRADWAAAWQRGHDLDPEDAVARALGQLPG